MKNNKILLRFDDICPTMNWNQWEKAKQLMDEKGVVALLGVIPDCKDPDLAIDEPRKDFWEYIKILQSKGFAIAMHGYQHLFDIRAKGIITPIKHSEFAGHPYDVQYNRIKKGKDILHSHGIDTDIFFAPAHSYDDNTLKALFENGFRYLSDGMSNKPYYRHGVLCIPTSIGIPKFKQDYQTIVFHAHEWVRADKIKAFYKFQKMCNELSDKVVSFDDFLKWKPGNTMVQRAYEVILFYMRCKIVPFFHGL